MLDIAFSYLGEAFTILFSLASLALIVVTLPGGIDALQKKIIKWREQRAEDRRKRVLYKQINDPQPGDYKTEILPVAKVNRRRREVEPQDPPAIEDDP